jgi:hypothetical protein
VALARGRLTGVADLSGGPLPEERSAGLTSEVPPGLQASAPDPPSSPVRVLLFGRADPLALSDLAAAQVTCTVAAALSVDQANRVDAVVLVDKPGHQRGPLTCPVRLPG